MINLIICIALTSLLFVIFKYFEIFKVRTFEAVVFNYLVCGVSGILFTSRQSFEVVFADVSWLPFSIALGSFFLGTFFLMALCTQQLGVTITSTAGKISMVIPVCFALFFLDKIRDFDFWNTIGLFLSLFALLLTSYSPKSADTTNINKRSLWLVPTIFLLTGLVDSTINFVNTTFPSADFQKVFPTITFFFAATPGLLILTVKRKRVEFRSILGGIALGVPNYFSIYFLMRALSDFDGNGAALFPLSHIGGILLSMVLGYILFKERMSRINYIGVLLSLITIFLLGHQKIIALF